MKKDTKSMYLKLKYNESRECKQLQSNYICYMNVTFEWEKEEDLHCVYVCVCVSVCFFFGGGGWRIR